METFLLIVGTLGMGLGTVYFVYLGIQSKEGITFTGSPLR